MTARKDGFCFLYLCVAKKVLKNIAHNVLQLGAVCVGLWEGNCAKVLLYDDKLNEVQALET